jgi:pimeloyl-ACP methyl ester carboxylesterase
MAATSTPILIGSGPRKVLALHGWFGQARGWGAFTQHLNTEDFSYAFLDYRGYGQRKGSGGPYTNAQIAQDALALADQLGWQSFALMGHSMGGKAMQQVLAVAPTRVQALVGITPVPAMEVPFDEANWAFFSSAANSADARYGIIDMTTGKRHTSVWLGSMVQNSQTHSDAEAFAGYLLAWAKESFVERIQGKTTPVLVLVGEHDPAISADMCKNTWLQHYPKAQLQVLPAAGHYPMDETPIALATAVENFLREVM